jgi:hypothetical protein
MRRTIARCLAAAALAAAAGCGEEKKTPPTNPDGSPAKINQPDPPPNQGRKTAQPG